MYNNGRRQWQGKQMNESGNIGQMSNKMLYTSTYASPDEAKAANDSRLLRPNNVCGTRDIVTTECRRPDDVDAYTSSS